MTDKGYKPSLDEVSEYIGNPLFDELCERMRIDFKATVEIAYSGDNVLLGWNVRFYHSGSTLCRIYPKRGRFSVLIVVGRREKERVEAQMAQMSDKLQSVYRNTPEGMGQRWLILDFDRRDAAYADILRLVQIRKDKKG